MRDTTRGGGGRGGSYRVRLPVAGALFPSLVHELQERGRDGQGIHRSVKASVTNVKSVRSLVSKVIVL